MCVIHTIVINTIISFCLTIPIAIIMFLLAIVLIVHTMCIMSVLNLCLTYEYYRCQYC